MAWAVEGDGIPTQGMREIYQENSRELAQLEKDLSTLLNGDLARLNELARKLEVPNIIHETPRAAQKKVATK